MRRAALLLAAVALGGCETTAEKSAKLEKVALRLQREAHARGEHGAAGLSVATLSRRVHVISTALVVGKEGDAAVLVLRNSSASSLADVPISITVRDSSGASLYTNSSPGLAGSLVRAALIPAHGEITWIDDQVQASGTPASVTARIGEGRPATGAVPKITVAGVHRVEEAGSSSIEGEAVNESTTAQPELVVNAVASSGGRVVAAGRAVVPNAAAHAHTRFQLFLTGTPGSAPLTYTAPATAAG